MKSFLFALFILISFDLFAQTITAKPIYEGSQSLTIDILQSGRIWFGFQNPDYQTIVDIKSFTVSSKEKAIELIDKAIYILAMNKTDRNQNIRDEYENVSLTRYGFAQKQVYLSNDLSLNINECNKIKQALKNYQN
jgi:uncharacterized Zn finger protein